MGCLNCFSKGGDSGENDSGPRLRDANQSNPTRQTAPSPRQEPATVQSTSQPNSACHERHNDENLNLWSVAESRLDPDTKKWLHFEKSEPIADVLLKINSAVEEKYTDYRKKDLEIRKRGGGAINFRESAKKIIIFTLQAQDLISAVAEFDPTGHASTAWGLIKNDIERRDSLMEACEFLAGVLTYHAIIEHNYLSIYATGKQGLEDALVDVYVAILQYTAEIQKASNENIQARAWKSITALVDKPLQSLKASVVQKSEVVERWKTLTQDEWQTERAEGILAAVDDMVAKLQEINMRTRTQEELEILEWLSNTPYSKIQNQTQQHRSMDTGQWFLEREEYTSWKATPGQILWLNGVVGCGKSVLCYQETQNIEAMVRCLIRQLAPNPLPVSVLQMWQSHRGNREPDYKNLIDTLDSVINYLSGDVYLVFDALDECPFTASRKERQLLLQFIEHLIEQHPSKLHILATSRPEPDIRVRLEKHNSFDLELGLGGDVEVFVRSELKDGQLSRWAGIDASILATIEQRLLGTHERRFRWADLQIKRLQECHTLEDIHQALQSVPTSLEETYGQILDRIDVKYQTKAQDILSWLSFSLEPLTLEIVSAVASLPFSDSVVQICTTSLITVNKDGVVRLAHFSVKEFLVSERVSNTPWFHLSAKLAHTAILERLLSELHAHAHIELTEAQSKQKPLLVYAATLWDSHLRELGGCNCLLSTDIGAKIQSLFSNPLCYLNWIRIRNEGRSSMRWHRVLEECEPPIFQASKMGLVQVVEYLIEAGADPLRNCRLPTCTIGSNAVTVAAEEGHLSVLGLLLDAAAVVSKPDIIAVIRGIHFLREDKAELEAVIEKLCVMGYLGKSTSDGITEIDADIIIEAARNPLCGPTLMEALLSKTNKRLDHISQEISRSALRNSWCGHDIIEFLLKREDFRIQLPLGDICELASGLLGRTPSLARVIFVNLAEEIKGEPDILREYAHSAKAEVVECILHIYGDDLIVTSKVLVAAAGNTRDPRVFPLILAAMKDESRISNDVFCEAARNPRQGFEIMKALLNSCGPEYPMGESIMLEVVSNIEHGENILREFLLRQQRGFVVSEDVLTKAAKCTNRELMELLITNSDSDIPITENLLCAAAECLDSYPILEYLLGFLEPDYRVTDDFLISAAKGNCTKTMSMLLTRYWQPTIPDIVLITASHHRPIMQLILDQNHNIAPISQIIEHLTQGYGDPEVFELLFERNLLSINAQLVEKVAGNHWLLQSLLNCTRSFPVTNDALFEAVNDFDSMSILLGVGGENVTITEEIMRRIIELPVDRSKIYRMLFARLGEKVPITEDLLIHAVLSYDIDALRTLLEQERSLDLQSVWRGLFKKRGVLIWASDVFLEYTNFEVTENLLEFLIEEEAQYGKPNDGLLDRLLVYAMQRHIPIPFDGRAMEIILEWLSLTVILDILELNSGISITEEMINAAMKNVDPYEAIWIVYSILGQNGECAL
ncbi:hypothetical protein N7528_006809 [Penicillium herquei]|nr:hypothetical protein N7528_006809 [Penicillium herquei]